MYAAAQLIAVESKIAILAAVLVTTAGVWRGAPNVLYSQLAWPRRLHRTVKSLKFVGAL
jgi:hypothetical protein